MEHPPADLTLDTSGTYCPVPIIETAKAVRGMEGAQVLQVIATDPGVVSDMPAWCKSTRHEYLGLVREEGRFRLWVRKRAAE